MQCDSRFLSDVETRCVLIELELLAPVWACKNCDIYLKSKQTFEVLLNHRPLIPALNNKTLVEIENLRLQRLQEKLIPYSFVTTLK